VGEYVGVKNAGRVIAISKKIHQALVQRYGRDDIMVIPNGVAISEISPQTGVLQRYNLESQQYILAVGRFVPEKGFHDLLQAYSRIADPEFKLVIVGDADHETDYSRMIRTMAHTIKGVVLTGRLPRRQLPELYEHAQLFVLPSSYEGLPLTLLEALNYNVPTLVSDIPAHREFRLGDYRYFPVGNIEVLNHKIIELRNKNITNEEQSRRKKILERYDWDRIADRTFSVYASLVDLQSGSAGHDSKTNTGC
jgi:glycosyltransferase involved in cell wall biosynthesis